MGLLDVFRSDETIRARHAREFSDDLARSEAILERYLTTPSKMRRLADTIEAAARAKGARSRETPPAPAQSVCLIERKQLFEHFQTDLVELEDEERLTEEEELLVKKLKEGRIFKVSDLLLSAGHKLENFLLLLRTLHALKRKELCFVKLLQTDIEHIFTLQQLIENEAHLYQRFAQITEEEFRPLLKAAKTNEMHARLEQKMSVAEKKIEADFAAQTARHAAEEALEEERDALSITDPKSTCSAIYFEILAVLGCPLSADQDVLTVIEEMDRLVQSDKELGAIIKRVAGREQPRKRLSEKKLGEITERFRTAYNRLDFADIDLT